MPRYSVVSTGIKGHTKRVTVADGRGNRVHLAAHRYALIGTGNTLEIDPRHTTRLSIVSSENSADLVRVAPHFETTTAIRIGEAELPLRISEITTKVDIDDHSYLEAFHYRTSVLDTAGEDEEKTRQEESGGRRAVLLCRVKRGPRWEAVGYIELTMPLMMAKPRHELFNRPFRHPTRPISWTKWDQETMIEFVNTIVRIGRVVTSPEYRGVGLARVLISAAKLFAIERWHVGGVRPLFMEISAEMLKYLDFVTSSGLRFAGLTEGNLHRIHDDLQSMRKGYVAKSGIMTLQKKYLSRLESACRRLDRSFDSVLELLDSVVTDRERMGTLPPEDYYLLKLVVRPQIPYYIGGLDEASSEYVEAGVTTNVAQREGESSNQFIPPATRISIKSLSITSKYQLPATAHVRTIMDCFGLKGDELRSEVVGSFPFEATSGNVIFISGPSGSGKSVLLRALDPNFSSPHLSVSAIRNSQNAYTVGWMRELPSDTPLIQYFAERCGIERGIAALNQAGLSEAFVYLKPFQLLSRGQQYRAMLADLAVRLEQVWLIDEFCADLDPMTARIVASNLRKHVVKYRRIAVVAAASHWHYLDALRPTRIIHLRASAKPEVFTYREYVDEFHSKTG
jgi:ABC-type transport system involved in cytochrome c biogenesis ATPase subunit/GNAT superfamily N-acetyltransferase